MWDREFSERDGRNRRNSEAETVVHSDFYEHTVRRVIEESHLATHVARVDRERQTPEGKKANVWTNYWNTNPNPHNPILILPHQSPLHQG